MDTESSTILTKGVSIRYSLTMEWLELKTLGQGSFGVVDLVKIINSVSYLVAVKQFPSANLSLWREYRILRRFIGCSNIVQVYDMLCVEYDHMLCYSMFLEYASGGSLWDLIRNYGGKIPESDVKCYTRMLLEGLYNIHNKDYVHCDLKPANILVFPSQCGSLSTLKISDFGLAKGPREREVPETPPRRVSFQSTTRYMSPEFVKDGKISASLDMWSLGCVVAEMMIGKPPWDSISKTKDLALLIGLTNHLLNIPQDMSEAGKDFLMKCFARDPSQRWTADRLLHHPFLLFDYSLFAPQRSFLEDALAKTYRYIYFRQLAV